MMQSGLRHVSLAQKKAVLLTDIVLKESSTVSRQEKKTWRVEKCIKDKVDTGGVCGDVLKSLLGRALIPTS